MTNLEIKLHNLKEDVATLRIKHAELRSETYEHIIVVFRLCVYLEDERRGK